MKRFASMFLTVIMFVAFMAIPAKATGEAQPKIDGYMVHKGGSNDLAPQINISMSNISYKDSMKLVLKSGTITLAEVVATEAVKAIGQPAELSCPIFTNGGSDPQYWTQTTYPLYNKNVPTEVELILDGKVMNTYKFTNLSKETWTNLPKTSAAGFNEKSTAWMFLFTDYVAVELEHITVYPGSSLDVTLFSGGVKLSTATLVSDQNVEDGSLTCPIKFDPTTNRWAWRNTPFSTLATNKMPDRVDVTINGETRSYDKYVEGRFSREAWLNNKNVKNPIESTEQDTKVVANVEPTFVVSIPKVVDFGTLNKKMPEQSVPFTVSVENALIETDANIVVTLDKNNAMEMKTQKTIGSAVLSYELRNQAGKVEKGNPFCSFNYESVKDNQSSTATGTVNCSPETLKAAGSYSGTMKFNISYQYNK